MSSDSEEAETWAITSGIEVSDQGRVREGSHGRPFVPRKLSNGYRTVTRGGVQFAVHRLVATVFLGPCPGGGFTVHHRNMNKLDNRLSNLKWADASEQNTVKKPFRHAQNAPQVDVDLGNGKWVTFDNVSTVAEKYDMSVNCIHHCIAGRNKTHKGARFRYTPVDKCLDGEVWKETSTCMVSNLGRVKAKDASSKSNVNGLPYYPIPGEHGYCKAFGRDVHIMVAEAFLGPKPSPHLSVDHINRKRHDNRYSNLKWATAKDQRRNSSFKAGDQSNRCRKVQSTDSAGNSLRFPSIAAAAKYFGIKPPGIAKALSQRTVGGKPKKASGQMWTRLD